MKKRSFLKLFFRSFLVGALVIPGVLFSYSSPGMPTGLVNDFAHVLSDGQKNVLEQKLRNYEASTTNEVAVVTIKSLDGDYIENYAVKLFEEWKIGKEKEDNGVLLLVALDDHKIRIEVGYGLEGALPDGVASRIITNDLTPAFKQNDFYGGIDSATDHIIAATKGEYVARATGSSSGLHFSFETIMIIIVVVFQFLSSILGRSKSWWAGGVLGAGAGVALTFFHVLGMTVVVGAIFTVVLTLVGLLFDYFVSSQYTQAVSSGSSIPWWVGGGRSGGGGSFGGFGGGSSGGGGASGSW